MRSFLVIVVVFGLTTIGFAEIIQVPSINVLQDNGSHITIEYILHGYDMQTVDINGKSYSQIRLPEQVTFLEQGLPELPTIARNIIIPDDALMGYRILDIEYETKKVAPLAPSKGNLLRTVDPNAVPYTFDNFYTTDSWWPEKTIELYEPFILRDYRGMTIRFNPFQYNPVKNELQVVKRIVIELSKIGTGGKNVVVEKSNSVTREFAGIYKNVFLNFNDARYDSLTERAGRMVIITDDDYVNILEEFIAWKRQKGIDTKMVTITSIGGNTEVNIKNCIQDEYDAGDLVWVLLVGDGNEVRPATGTLGDASGEDADPVYAYTAGDDYYPDIFISRFSSRSGDSTAILKQISRSIKYEREPELAADWYHIGLGVASNQTGGSPYADSTRCNWLRDSLLGYTYTDIKKQYQGGGGSSSGITQDIEAGLSIINYIGHGWTGGWSSINYTASHINSLNNPWMLPFVISCACLIGNFDGSDCFCEASVTAGTVDTADGFLVHWGSTINQTWVPPCIGQSGAVNRLTHNLSNTAGGIMFNGACYMIEYYGGGEDGVEMAQTWHIFGDASVQLRTDTPQEITVNHPDSIDREQVTFDVSVPGVASALVGLYTDTVLVGSGYTDTLGNATIDVGDIPGAADSLFITVTAYNKVPYISTIPILSLAVEEAESNGVATKTALTSLHPNPFSDKLTIAYSLGNSAAGTVLAIYNSIGQLVKRYDYPTMKLSDHVIWDGQDQRGHAVPGGIYFVYFTVGDFQQIEKAIFLR
jgi:hypothetical protein